MRLSSCLLFVFLLVSGCHSPDEPLPYPITMNKEGLGPIRIGDAFEIGAIQGKLPGFTVEKMSRVTPERSETVFFLKRGEMVLAHIFPGDDARAIEAITLCTEQIQDIRGQRIGTKIQGSKDLLCSGATCRYGTEPSLRYLIDPETRIIREITLQKL